ncbi:MAG: glycosyltransferase family 2 protein [Microgenomates group bacterium]
MSTPLVSIVIVTFNSEIYLHECLRSVLENRYKRFEVIIFDNNSTDQTHTIIKKYSKKYPKIISATFHNKNIGFAAANNNAIEIAKGKLVFILNPDTTVDSGFLEPLVAEISKENVAAVQPLVYLFDKKTINLTGKVMHYLGFDWLRDYKSTQPPRSQEIHSFSGSGILINKQHFFSAGMFDEFYFMYYEDSDLSWKFNLLGKKMLFTPASILYHDYKYIPQESYQPLKQKYFYIERNRLITMYKNYSAKSLFLLIPIFIFMELGLITFAFLDGWGITKLSTYAHILQNIPQIQKKRTDIQNKRVVSDKQLFKHMQSTITFEKFANPLINSVANPILNLYFHFLKAVS